MENTPERAIGQIKQGLGWTANNAYCGRGYRGHGYEGETNVHIVGQRAGPEIAYPIGEEVVQ